MSRWRNGTVRGFSVFEAPLPGRCGIPDDHRVSAGLLPAMRERIVRLLAGHDLLIAIGAPPFARHVEGVGPNLPSGAQLVQIIEDAQIAAWAPLGRFRWACQRHGPLLLSGLSVVPRNLTFDVGRLQPTG